MTHLHPAVPLTALNPYLGRFVRLVLDEEGAEVRGFLTDIRSSTIIIDHTDRIRLHDITAAYNIVNELIAGEET